MERLPVYVDPNDALAGRYMVLLNRQRKCNWPPEFDYSDLKPDQERYGIISGIGNDAHFAPDYRIGLELGLGRLAWPRSADAAPSTAPDKAEFYEAEERVDSCHPGLDPPHGRCD